MSSQAAEILACLTQVAAERARRNADAVLARGVMSVKHYQQARFAHTYADLLGNPRYASAARFFLDELYGPADFSRRDEQFAKVISPMTRMLPRELLRTILMLAQLHLLSEELDSCMGLELADAQLDGANYAAAWRALGRPEDRERQIALTVAIGSELQHYTRNPLVRHSLRLMRGPAQAAGLGALQQFLEMGFDAFRQMKGATEFLDTVALRERELAARLFAGGDGPSP